MIKFKPSSGQVQAEINISVGYQRFCTKPSEQGLISELVEMSPNSGMLRSKLTKT